MRTGTSVLVKSGGTDGTKWWRLYNNIAFDFLHVIFHYDFLSVDPHNNNVNKCKGRNNNRHL